jgi:hypothetical protein
MMGIKRFLLLIGILWLPLNANADLITYEFTGHITNSEFYIGMINPLASDLGIHIGEQFSGSFAYDTSQAPNTRTGYTLYTNENCYLSVSLTSDIYQNSLAQRNVAIVRINPNAAAPPPFTINPIYANSGTFNISTSNSGYNGWGLNFYDNSGENIFDNGLPSKLPALSSWDFAGFWFGFDWLGGGCGMARGTIDSLTPTPEPATLFLFGSGLIGLIRIQFTRRRKGIKS